MPSPTRPRATIAGVIQRAVAAAVVAACVHVAQVDGRFRILAEFTWTGRELAWLALGGSLETLRDGGRFKIRQAILKSELIDTTAEAVSPMGNNLTRVSHFRSVLDSAGHFMR